MTAGRELRARTRPNYDAASFHAQQAAEKYLKAFLTENGVAAPRTHELVELLELCLLIDASFQSLRNQLVLLGGYAVRFRYPGEWATAEQARQAFTAVNDVRAFIRHRLGLP